MDSAMKLEIASQPRWKIRRNASADMIWGVHLSGVLRLIDTRGGSRKWSLRKLAHMGILQNAQATLSSQPYCICCIAHV